MTDKFNIGNAILITACLYFNYIYGFNWGLIILIILGVATWSYAGFNKERKEYWKARIELLKAKAEYYRRRD
jgi:hypothetical protein